jgi:hypothetical protein
MNVEAYRAILRRLGVEDHHVESVVPVPALHDSTALADLLAMPLDVFAREGRAIEVRVPWWPATIWFVPDIRNAEALCCEGIARPRVWTADELLSLLTAAPLTTGVLATVMRARGAFDGQVVEVRRR